MASGFSTPTAMAQAPDGRLFVAEKKGRVRVVDPGGTLRTTPLLDISARVNSYSDRGLLGIATDKDFADNGYLYLLYVYELSLMQDTDAPMVARLTRVTVKPDSTLENPSSPETPILGTDVSGPCPEPDNTRDCIPADFKWHVIGTVRSDPVDGTLWVGVGDTHPPRVDQHSYRPYDEHSFAGKILHVDRNGNGLPGHPFCPQDENLTHTCTKIYAKGFRNPFRFTLRPGKGPVVGDVGNEHREELDLVKPGENYGWPCYEGTIHTPLYASQERCQQEYAKEGTDEAAAPPVWDYEHGSGASITAGPVYTGSGYPTAFRDDVIVGDYVQGWLKRIELGPDDERVAVHDFASGWPTGVDIQATLDNGDIAYVDIGYSDGVPKIRRIRYTGDPNGPPTAVATATPISGDAPLEVGFTGSDSTDPDGDELSYRWDFGDDSEESTKADPTHVYAAEGTYTATLTVDDGHGHSDGDSVPISVGNAAPSASIDAPADGFLYRGGEAVQLEGSGSDPEEGPLEGDSLQWEVRLHHGSHVHPLTGGSGAQMTLTPETDHDADSWYEIELSATDSGELVATDTIAIRPETVSLTLDSSPAGVPLGYAGLTPLPAPFSRTAGIGFEATVQAPETFLRNGGTYRFERWSDGGEPQHELAIPAVDLTLTASYLVADAPPGTSDGGQPGHSEQQPPSPPPAGQPSEDRAGPVLRFDRTRGVDLRRGLIRGRADDPSGVRAVTVAFARVDRGRCRWLVGAVGRLARRATRCSRPRWTKALLVGEGGSLRWRARLPRRLPPGAYRILLRAIDQLGNESRRRTGGRPWIELRAPAARLDRR